MTTPAPERCPKCGAEIEQQAPDLILFKCGAFVIDGEFQPITNCYLRIVTAERDAALKRAEIAERDLAASRNSLKVKSAELNKLRKNAATVPEEPTNGWEAAPDVPRTSGET